MFVNIKMCIQVSSWESTILTSLIFVQLTQIPNACLEAFKAQAIQNSFAANGINPFQKRCFCNLIFSSELLPSSSRKLPWKCIFLFHPYFTPDTHSTVKKASSIKVLFRSKVKNPTYLSRLRSKPACQWL